MNKRKSGKETAEFSRSIDIDYAELKDAGSGFGFWELLDSLFERKKWDAAKAGHS